MMDWRIILQEIHEILTAPGLNDVSAEIHDAQLQGGTLGEIFSLVVGILMSIKTDRPEVYALIREETDWMIAYAKKIGYW